MKRRSFLKTALAAVALTMSTASLAVRAAVADICSKVRRRPWAIKLPPIPKWNKFTDDIDGADFLRRSRDYERRLLPPNLVFPRTGQVWEAVSDCEAGALRFMAGPHGPVFSSSTQLRKGERVRIIAVDDPKPLEVRFVPLRHMKLHQSLAADGLGCELSMRTACTVPVSRERTEYFTELFRLVEPVA